MSTVACNGVEHDVEEMRRRGGGGASNVDFRACRETERLHRQMSAVDIVNVDGAIVLRRIDKTGTGSGGTAATRFAARAGEAAAASGAARAGGTPATGE